jgi:uncharacterized repeat protein (TIGR03803 family)
MLATVLDFTGDAATNTGANPTSSLLQASDGTFYGTTTAGGPANFGTIFKLAGGVLTTLERITEFGTNTRGAYPYAGLVEGKDGNLWGSTRQGGTTDNGVIFKLTPYGALTKILDFTGATGANPGVGGTAEFLLASDGNFYAPSERWRAKRLRQRVQIHAGWPIHESL